MDDATKRVGRGIIWSATALLIDGSGPRGALFVPQPLSDCLYEASLLPPDRLDGLIIVEWQPTSPRPFVFVGRELAQLAAARNSSPTRIAGATVMPNPR